VPGPPLAERRVGQQGFNVALDGRRRRVGLEGAHVVRLRRQPGEDEAQSAGQHGPVGRGGGRQVTGFQFGFDEAIDRVVGPRRVADVGDGGLADRLEAPPGAPFADDGLPVGVAARARRVVPRVGGTNRHPALQVGDLLGRELLVRRHLQGLVGMPDGPHQSALVRLARDEGRAGVATGAQGVAGVQAEATLLLVGPVAAVTLLDQDRADTGLEEGNAVVGTSGAGGEEKGDGNEAAHSRPGYPAGTEKQPGTRMTRITTDQAKTDLY
jgi:hypothetical protein